VCKDGFILNDRDLVRKFNPDTALFVIGGSEGYGALGDALRTTLSERGIMASYLSENLSRSIKGALLRALKLQFMFLGMSFAGGRIFVPGCVLRKVNSLKPGAELRAKTEILQNIPEKKDWATAKLGNTAVDFSKIGDVLYDLEIDESSPVFVCALSVSNIKRHKGRDVVSGRWEELLGVGSIPFDKNSRREVEAQVYAELEAHLELWRLENSEREKDTVENSTDDETEFSEEEYLENFS